MTEGWMTPSLFDGIPNKDLLVCDCDCVCIYLMPFSFIICLESREINLWFVYKLMGNTKSLFSVLFDDKYG